MSYQSTTYARLLRPGDQYVEMADPEMRVFVVIGYPEVGEHRVRVPTDGGGALYPRNERVRLWNNNTQRRTS